MIEPFLSALYSMNPFRLLADVYLTSDSTDVFNFWFFGGQNWRDVKIQYIHGHADFCDPSVETGILYRVPEPSWKSLLPIHGQSAEQVSWNIAATCYA